MKTFGSYLAAIICAGVTAAGAEPLVFDFNSYEDGPLEGQQGWSVYNKVRDSSAFSVVDGVGKTDKDGDKALVLQSSKKTLRLVAPKGLSWMPGEALLMEFDFKLGLPARELLSNKPVLTVFVGNSYLTEKARWTVQIEATTDGSWRLMGGLPDWQGVDGIPAERIVEQPENGGAAISDWFHFVLTTRKLNEPDSFESQVKLTDSNGQVIASRTFSDTLKDSRTAAMWNLSRIHCGFNIPRTQFGLTCIDNLTVSTVCKTVPEPVASGLAMSTKNR